jgi:hypothetical protein
MNPVTRMKTWCCHFALDRMSVDVRRLTAFSAAYSILYQILHPPTVMAWPSTRLLGRLRAPKALTPNQCKSSLSQRPRTRQSICVDDGANVGQGPVATGLVFNRRQVRREALLVREEVGDLLRRSCRSRTVKLGAARSG